MHVNFNTYPWAFGEMGGGERQLHSYHSALTRGKGKWPNLHLSFFDQWAPDFDSIDLMHFFGCMHQTVDFLDYIKIKRKIPLILSPNFWPNPEEWEKSGVLPDIKKILWLADKIIVNSEIEHEWLVRHCKIDSLYISVVYNGVDDTFFNPRDPNIFRNKYDINGKYILNVANVETRKNQLNLIKALKNYPDLTLVNIGFVRDKRYFDNCVAEAGGRFVSLGALPPNSDILASAYNGCEFFAMPSFVETPSIASLEAGAQGAKLLTTDRGSPTEYFEDLATYIDPYDVQKISSAIGDILDKPRDERLSERIYENYRWDLVVDNLFATYFSVISNPIWKPF